MNPALFLNSHTPFALVPVLAFLATDTSACWAVQLRDSITAAPLFHMVTQRVQRGGR